MVKSAIETVSGQGFISTLPYNALQHIFPNVFHWTVKSLIPDKLVLPYPQICKPGHYISDRYVLDLNHLINISPLLEWDDYLAYWFGFWNNPNIQCLRFFQNQVVYLSYKEGEFVFEYSRAGQHFIKLYRQRHPEKKDTDVLRAIIRKDDDLYLPPFTKEWIRDYYVNNWSKETLYPVLHWFFEGRITKQGIHYINDYIEEDTETYKTMCIDENLE